MDALKSAGRAIIRSPSIARHTLGVAASSRHEKLPENWTDTKETLLEGMVFNLKYLGMTLVEQPKGEEMAAAAIRRIVSMARASAKKFRKITITVSPKGLLLQDTETNEIIENVSIYRISYCTTDKAQDKVFAYIAQNQMNETLECHAFLSPKKKIAQAVTLTVAQAFKIALDLWETAQEEKCKQPCRTTCSPEATALSGSSSPSLVKPDTDEAMMIIHSTNEGSQSPFTTLPVCQLRSESQHSSPIRGSPIKQSSWDTDDELDEAFSSAVDNEEQMTD
ncbi:low density lipoprotein receptor adapter protein 1-like isoform X2 [Protopterus annectens]|uniref:low density lipoprotein receptor adapter protein 1-like isoform X2 n=1 Tax=Protopterus annectens TaxID=7888 RepID=UPI001CFB0C15|nr:low density lipoprotein receptor adapter protein 1-like isoform X2 [Protopterus annectens]